MYPTVIKLNWGLQGYTLYCGYSLEPPHYVLSKNKKIITSFHLKISIFTANKYCSIFHSLVIVMQLLSVYILTEEGKDAKRTYSFEAYTAKMDWPCHKNA